MTVTVRFCGAARTVTGSCYLFQSLNGRLLVDCGLFQGSKTLKALNYGAFPFRPADIDTVLLTHAHIDHSGLLPKLVREGFRGRILATRGTIDLCSYMLPDAGSIQESEVATLNRRNSARGRSEVNPIYTQADAIASLDAFRPIDYETWSEVMPGVRARYWNAGHLLGSASIELEFAGEGSSGQPLRVLASGDIGPDAKLLQPDPKHRLDSTMSFRNRPTATVDRRDDRRSRRQHLAAEVRDAASAKGALLIPAFAVERTQELIVDLVDLMERGEMPTAPIFSIPRSPFAPPRYFGNMPRASTGHRPRPPVSSPHLRFTETVDESKSIAKLTGFHIIIAASGMCDAGRIRHHLKRWLWHSRRNRAVGRLSGARYARALSRRRRESRSHPGRGDQGCRPYPPHRRLFRPCRRTELARWIAARRPIHRGVFLVHGEEPALSGLSERIAERISSRGEGLPPHSGRHLRSFDIRAHADRCDTPPTTCARSGGLSRLAQRDVETHPRHQRPNRSSRRRPRTRRHYPELAARSRRATLS